MKNKALMIGGVGLAAIVAGRYLYNLNRLKNQLVIETQTAINNGNMVVMVTMKNPTGGIVSVKHPYVAMYSGKEKQKLREPFVSSSPENRNYKLEKYAAITLEPIVFPGIVKSLAAASPGLAMQLLKEKQLNVIVETTTTINGALPYSKEDTFTLDMGKILKPKAI